MSTQRQAIDLLIDQGFSRISAALTVRALGTAGFLVTHPPIQPLDPLARIKVGDPDPTSWTGPWCMTPCHGDEAACTREPGHPEHWHHIAGDNHRVYATSSAPEGHDS